MSGSAADLPAIAALWHAALWHAAFLVVAMASAGVAHVLWLRSAAARAFARPIDGGRTFRGRRIFGDNKQVRGLVAMPPAAALAFVAWAAAWPHLVQAPDALWPMSLVDYAALGFACGLAFMLAELPNSFVKRQLGIAPGATGRSPAARIATGVIDRLDSVLGVLIVATLAVGLDWRAWLFVLVAGPGIHALFSIALWRMGLKARPL